MRDGAVRVNVSPCSQDMPDLPLHGADQHKENLNHTVENYERNFGVVQQMLTHLYLNPAVKTFYSEASGGEESPMTIGGTGSTFAPWFFGKYYIAKDRPVAFWQEQFQAPYLFKLISTTTIAMPVASLNRLTVIVKNRLAPDMYVLASIQPVEMKEAPVAGVGEQPNGAGPSSWM